MKTVGLRELRQRASELVRCAEEGEVYTVTVSGRPAALLGPAGPGVWRRFEDLAELFGGTPDPAWVNDRERLDPAPRDPWNRE